MNNERSVRPREQNDKFPDLKFRRQVPQTNLSRCVPTAEESISVLDPIPSEAPSFAETLANNPHLSHGGYFR